MYLLWKNIAPHTIRQKVFDDQDLVPYELFWILCKWKV